MTPGELQRWAAEIAAALPPMGPADIAAVGQIASAIDARPRVADQLASPVHKAA